MKFVIKLFPEIMVKSDSVRRQITKILRSNLRSQFKRHAISADVQNRWDSLIVVLDPRHDDDESARRQALRILTHTPGIGGSLEIEEFDFDTLHDAYQHVRDCYRKRLSGKTFCVRLKRTGHHDFNSHEAEIYMGGHLLQETDAHSVSLKHPEVLVQAEIRNQKIHVVKKQHRGIGGFPLGSQGEVLSLISGGFDSTVSSYLMMRRGLKTHYCFFNLGGSAHEIGVKQVAHYLWSSYSESHRVKFVTVPFEDVVTEILRNVDTAQMGVVLKRMMLRAASQIADSLNLPALVTGEAVAQVASQTITNLAVIDRVCDHMVLRPLASMDKQDIIDIARRIGTETFAANMPEYCGVISVNPTIVGDRRKVDEAESTFDFSVLDRALQAASYRRIDEVLQGIDSGLETVEIINTPSLKDVVIDIRHPHEVEDTPLSFTSNTVLCVPFYDLEQRIHALQAQYAGSRFLLYCQKGTMSKIHAHHLNQNNQGRFAVYLDA